MSPVRSVLSSWKMYLTVDATDRLFGAIQAGLRERLDAGIRGPRVIVCPSFLSLCRLRAVADDSVVALGAQNCHWEDEGPYTGEISAKMLRGLASFVLVGHSERRDAGETDEQIARKVAAVVRNQMVPILLVGEDDRTDDALQQVEDRLRTGVSLVDVASHRVVVVYEPRWAIGTDDPAPAARIRRSVTHLKDVLRTMGAPDPECIYGGSVDESNLDQLLQLEVLDGVGVGRASLDAERFLQIVDRVAQAAGATREGQATGRAGPE